MCAAPCAAVRPAPMLGHANKSSGMCECGDGGPPEVITRRQITAKLHMDLCAVSGLGAGMDQDTAELITQLCTRAGMIMEDASAMALTIGSAPHQDWATIIDRLNREAVSIVSLLNAASQLANMEQR